MVHEFSTLGATSSRHAQHGILPPPPHHGDICHPRGPCLRQFRTFDLSIGCKWPTKAEGGKEEVKQGEASSHWALVLPACNC